MNGDRWDRIRQIFEEAEALAPAEREAFVRSACGADEELRHEVESLLRADEHARETRSDQLARIVG
jgi:serine/threonine-protein kinase